MGTTRTHDDDDDTGSFGEDTVAPLPVWKRPIWGLSPALLAGCLVLLLLAVWYLFLRSPAGQSTLGDQFGEADTAIPAWQETPSASSPSPSATVPAGAGAGVGDMNSLATDLKSELDSRDEKFRSTLNMLQESVSKLSEAIRKDETYAQETRRMVSDLETQISGLSARAAADSVAPTSATAQKKKAASPVSGMKIMSMENGMAWIRWQGSTWAVREGDPLGKVTITRIDPASRTVTTTGGILR
ncbi:conjugal transfer protein TraP [Salmonella enterica subsp. enterica serovar Muenchen]|uniref:conjugal transfer protein TraP n=1 Tax=Salmonella enterica TaxID=28901 RepID=UPI001F108214|nr:conjugal transfer protein TraP [Salmonella enterica]EAW2473700.1 keratin [Salmonella enterica subsp. enterica]EEJ6214454.1 conjugal transfer protein TraP [Salmonella enterica]MCH5443941.1 conjugal transfer protein TraP [Salmonella enterica subsp. enterica serovar Muenchen]